MMNPPELPMTKLELMYIASIGVRCISAHPGLSHQNMKLVMHQKFR